MGCNLAGSHTGTLVKNTQGIAQTTICMNSDETCRTFGNAELFLIRHILQTLGDIIGRNASKCITLATRHNRNRQFLNLCGGKNEHNVGWRFLNRFKKRIPSLCGKHMGFVDNEDFFTPLYRHKFYTFTEGTNLINTTVRRRINFQHIHGLTTQDLFTRRTFITRMVRRSVLAIDGAGENLGHTRFTCTTRAGEQIGMRHLILTNGAHQRITNLMLPYHIRKRLGAIFTIQCNISHRILLSHTFHSHHYRNHNGGSA